MELEVFSVYDFKCAAYMQPFFFNNRGQALRAFQDLATDPATIFAKHAGDFTLFYIGRFDDQSATFTAEVHTNLGKALEFQSTKEC